MFGPTQLTRRNLLKSAACGFGYLAFAGLAAEAAAAERRAAGVASAYQSPLAPKAPHFAARAKRVVFLFMQGGPSHVDTFDYKPQLQKDDGKAAGRNGRGGGKLLGSPFKFAKHGDSGLWISELYPHLSAHADELCLLNGMHCDNPAHPQATIQLHTGNTTFVRPSLGSWVLYGLGTSNQDLPGFVTINPPPALGGAQNYGSAFLPAAYQGTRVGGDARGIPDVANGVVPRPLQRKQLDLLQSMNRDFAGQTGPHEQLEGVIESFELGFRMQSAVPDLLDLSGESRETMALYGADAGPGANFGRQCLLARRFLEAGVRFVEVCQQGWDQHNNLKQALTRNAQNTDKAIAGLLTDLRRRGLLEDTLVIWGGEFGRTPGAQGADGRNHNNRGYTMWLAGGGVKGGMTYGATDEHGGAAVEDKVHVHDLHATALHLLGLDHERLTYRYAGRDFRLTDVYGNVVKDVIA